MKIVGIVNTFARARPVCPEENGGGASNREGGGERDGPERLQAKFMSSFSTGYIRMFYMNKYFITLGLN